MTDDPTTAAIRRWAAEKTGREIDRITTTPNRRTVCCWSGKDLVLAVDRRSFQIAWTCGGDDGTTATR